MDDSTLHIDIVNAGILTWISKIRMDELQIISLWKCLFPPWENDTTEDFFFSSGRSVSEGSLYPPRVVFTHERSEGCNWDPRGVKMPEDTLLSEEKKKSKVVSFFTWRMWLSSILEVIPTSSECLILKQPLQPQTASNSLKTASKQPQKYFFA